MHKLCNAQGQLCALSRSPPKKRVESLSRVSVCCLQSGSGVPGLGCGPCCLWALSSLSPTVERGLERATCTWSVRSTGLNCDSCPLVSLHSCLSLPHRQGKIGVRFLPYSTVLETFLGAFSCSASVIFGVGYHGSVCTSTALQMVSHTFLRRGIGGVDGTHRGTCETI